MNHAIHRFYDVAATVSGVIAPLVAAAVLIVVLRGLRGFLRATWNLFGLWLESRARRKREK